MCLKSYRYLLSVPAKFSLPLESLMEEQLRYSCLVKQTVGKLTFYADLHGSKYVVFLFETSVIKK